MEDEDWSWTRSVLDDRYVVKGLDVLGIGGFSIVRKAVSKDGQRVAIKQLLSKEEDYKTKFRYEVSIFKTLGLSEKDDHEKVEELRSAVARQRQLSSRASFRSDTPMVEQDSLARIPPIRDVIVLLLDYSQASDDALYTVLEFADGGTLEEMLFDRKDRKLGALEGLQLYEVVFGLTSALLWLHANGLTHLDVKPSNLMRFGSRWKLIDIDGVRPTGAVVPLEPAFYTPLYTAPELAKSLVADDESVLLSRSMDAWSLGCVLLDCLAGQPCYLRPKYLELTAADESDLAPWFRWIADETIPIDFLSHRDDHAASLMHVLLAKNPEHRASLPEVVTHAFFANVPFESLPPAPPPPALASPPTPKPPLTAVEAATLLKEVSKPSMHAGLFTEAFEATCFQTFDFYDKRKKGVLPAGPFLLAVLRKAFPREWADLLERDEWRYLKLTAKDAVQAAAAVQADSQNALARDATPAFVRYSLAVLMQTYFDKSIIRGSSHG
eukprot:gnl/MRDRNA2_/MRDRNA2_153975_c0_seq1.p1 gnl/MRDRNA2_/MRDRNA2_153975_c0~~gnl/MRDRNA2_/MRDRNA2_153975_c0_seq1.p1  ORF type:complete len:495 (+),score=101.16 gnl/MRDRNA2_/MRDRNA2_153975_c0_seq1:93-1577(+)